jgi:hypothetical protein
MASGFTIFDTRSRVSALAPDTVFRSSVSCRVIHQLKRRSGTLTLQQTPLRQASDAISGSLATAMG